MIKHYQKQKWAPTNQITTWFMYLAGESGCLPSCLCAILPPFSSDTPSWHETSEHLDQSEWDSEVVWLWVRSVILFQLYHPVYSFARAMSMDTLVLTSVKVSIFPFSFTYSCSLTHSHYIMPCVVPILLGYSIVHESRDSPRKAIWSQLRLMVCWYICVLLLSLSCSLTHSLSLSHFLFLFLRIIAVQCWNLDPYPVQVHWHRDPGAERGRIDSVEQRRANGNREMEGRTHTIIQGQVKPPSNHSRKVVN